MIVFFEDPIGTSLIIGCFFAVICAVAWLFDRRVPTIKKLLMFFCAALLIFLTNAYFAPKRAFADQYRNAPCRNVLPEDYNDCIQAHLIDTSQ